MTKSIIALIIALYVSASAWAQIATMTSEAGVVNLAVVWEGTGGIYANDILLNNYNAINIIIPDAYGQVILTATENARLTQLNCYGGKLTALDVSNCTELTQLSCYDNQLSALNVSTSLEYLDCSNNRLSALNINNCTALARVFCYNNRLSALDVSNCTELTLLSCYGNQLSALNVKANTKLQGLNCSNNQLHTLDVSANSKLEELECAFNYLTSLDVSDCTELITLQCSNNQLTLLNLSGCNKLEMVAATGQQINVSIANGATLFINPVYYHNKNGIEGVVINGTPRERGEEVVIPEGANEIEFTSVPIGILYGEEECPFSGTITTFTGGNTALNKTNTSAINIYSSPSAIEVSGVAAGEVVEVYTIGGAIVARSAETIIPLPQTGIYIVKVNGQSFKVKR